VKRSLRTSPTTLANRLDLVLAEVRSDYWARVCPVWGQQGTILERGADRPDITGWQAQRR